MSAGDDPGYVWLSIRESVKKEAVGREDGEFLLERAFPPAEPHLPLVISFDDEDG